MRPLPPLFLSDYFNPAFREFAQRNPKAAMEIALQAIGDLSLLLLVSPIMIIKAGVVIALRDLGRMDAARFRVLGQSAGVK